MRCHSVPDEVMPCTQIFQAGGEPTKGAVATSTAAIICGVMLSTQVGEESATDIPFGISFGEAPAAIGSPGGVSAAAAASSSPDSRSAKAASSAAAASGEATVVPVISVRAGTAAADAVSASPIPNSIESAASVEGGCEQGVDEVISWPNHG
ncbi:hypothetical protein BS78_07G008100 [Paspalum vaginatum]|nr:hypothetical protein BS78_07G008100 [Paspalum vaginatum]